MITRGRFECRRGSDSSACVVCGVSVDVYGDWCRGYQRELATEEASR